MKPPIPSPDGTIIREELEFDGKARSISYRNNVLASTRLLIKSGLFTPASYIAVLVVSILLAVILLPVDFRPLRALPLWQSFSIIAFAGFLYMVIFVPLTFPFYSFVQLLIRGRDETVVINNEGIYNTAKSQPISIVWRRVKWIISWSGDVFILTFGGGVFIPRHAFHTPQESENFVYVARQFLHKSRQNAGIPTESKRQ